METSKANVFSLRNFRLVFLGALVSDLGTVLYSFAVSFYLLEISGNNAFLQGLYLALCGVVNLLATPIGGVLGDRFNKGKIMFLCDYGKGAVILLATAAMFLLRDPAAHIPVLFAAGILGNIISGIFSPAAGALMPHIVEEDQLQQANSYLSVKNALQSILGVVLAGVLYAAMPIQPLFLLVGICYVISGVSEMFIRYDHKPSQESLTLSLALRDMGDGLSYIRSQGGLMALMAAILFINFFMTPVFSNFMPYFVKTDIAGAESYLFDSFLTPELWASVVDVILGEKLAVCAEEDIVCVPYLDGSLLDFVKPLDLCTLIGNAMDNAMESCRRIPEKERRSIRLHTAERGNTVVLSVRNTFLTTPDLRDGLPATTKVDAGNHGYGLRNMRYLAEQYGGMLSCRIEGEEFVLRVTLQRPD